MSEMTGGVKRSIREDEDGFPCVSDDRRRGAKRRSKKKGSDVDALSSPSCVKYEVGSTAGLT